MQVICLVVFLTMTGAAEPTQVAGTLVDDKAEVWIVDISAYLALHPEYPRAHLTRFINSNLCLRGPRA